MVIDIADIVKRNTQKMEITFSIEPNDIFVENSEVKLNDSLNFTGNLYVLGDVLNIEGEVTGTLKLVCSRCMEDFQYPLQLDIREAFSLVPNDEDDSIIFIDSDNINLTEIIESNILMSLPIKKLCSEDCKGLCQVCGANHNKVTCDCESQNIDPRLDNLKDLFFTD